METPTPFDTSTLEALDDATRGAVLAPDDAEYDDARTVWNDRYDRYPSAIVRCAGPADVLTAVDFATDRDVPVSVKGGGHDYGGYAVGDDCLMIDLSSLDSVRVDPDSQTARVGPGATWRAVDHETQAFGLATTGATVSTVGVAGYTLGGGTGHLARTCGISADNLVAADVVTANGELVHASETEHPDLFWALRGGGGNFGIVTGFEFSLHEIGPELLAGQIVHPFEEAADVLEFYRSYMADAPAAVNCYAFIVPIPPLPAFPEDRHGETAVNLVASYSGDVDAGGQALEPLREFGDPILDSVRPQPYTELQQAFDDGVPAGNRWCSRAQYLDSLPDDAIETLVDQTDPLRGPLTMVYLEPMGGGIAEVDPSQTAFPHRDAAYSIHALTGWTDPANDEEMIGWTETLHEAMEPYSSGGVYVNLLSRDEDRVPEAYGDNLDRLREVKAEWDPENLFSTNRNIEPTE
jgi:FAD/FMN-containing dehydrogenase